jgi:RNA recognition motif-containing protein
MEQDLSQLKKEKRRTIMNIYVGNLSFETTDETIREAFESFGEVTSARVIKDKYNGQSRGFGFVEMPAQSQAQTAIKSLNGKELLGKQISVNEARPRADQGRSRGGRMDYSGRGNRY